ncbi:MAG: DUF2442 domain-containing protein [Flavobacteriaceae bacterium]|jgi:hypothetical protein|nr:DUF2442 domain-containing protein [Flavobacteriaceae bacterium]
MNPKVIKVQPDRNYMLNLWFSNGEQRCFDMKPYLDFEVFQALKNPKLFDTATAFLGSVTWSNDADLSYDTLYLEGIPMSVES